MSVIFYCKGSRPELFKAQDGSRKEKEGVRGRTTEGVIRLYCYASIVIIQKRLEDETYLAKLFCR